MKSLSVAVDTAWKLAVWEASAAKSEFIEKEHAVIGLMSLEKVASGKPDDMKLNREQWNSIRAEWDAMREVFAACAIDATVLRRELRKRISTGSHQHTENVIHRSSECKAFFQIAAALEEHSTSKLIGSPPGYVGYDEEGQLTGKLRTKPYSILLLDEAEKAHPKVFDLFLQLFDDGRITDAKGRTVDASNCIIILTSNIKPGKAKRLGFGAQDEPPKPDDIPELKQFFRPELLNRLDEQILFNSLEKEDIKQILEPILSAVCKRLKDQHGIRLEIAPEVKDLLADKGYKPEYGARELRRVVERELEMKLAEKILNFNGVERNWRVVFDQQQLMIV